MEHYFSGALLGSLITIILQAIISVFMERTKHKRELKLKVFERKTEVVEKAMSWLQECCDTYRMLQMSLRAYDEKRNPYHCNGILSSVAKSDKLFRESESRFNSLYLYYDFSDIEKKYNANESMIVIHKLFSIVSEITQIEANIQDRELMHRFANTLNNERIDTFRLCADALDSQILICTEIMQRLRDEYKSYLINID
ncbi:MAG: hypothetical protein SOW56_02280 [Bacteroidaceae bacterium]|nr:hypothetical protein [Bacteroidaceae bacterium]